jgi:hypothetical protein
MLLSTALPAGFAQESALPKNLRAELNPPAVPGVTVTRVTATGAEIAWPASLATGEGVRVEVRRFALGEDRELRMDWAEWPGVSVTRHGEHFQAKLRELTPRQPYWIRVLPRGAAEPIFAVRFDTPARVPIFTARRIAIAVLIAVLAALLWLRWRR